MPRSRPSPYALAGVVALMAGACAEPPTPEREPERAREVPAVAEPASAPTEAASSSAHAVVAAAPSVEPTPSAAPEASPAPAGARIYAKARFVWVRAAPGAKSWIGYLTIGGSAPLRGGTLESARVGGGGSCKDWYAIEPQGYVCANDQATVDPEDPAFRAIAEAAGDISSPWPYSYAESLGTPRYATIPTLAQQRAKEWDYDHHMERVRLAKEASDPEAVAAIDKDLIGVDVGPAGVEAPSLFEVGPYVREARARVIPGSTVAYTRQFDADGRTYLLTDDYALVPKDRVRPYPHSDYSGVALTDDVRLPIAMFREDARPKYRRGADGVMTPTGETWSRLSWVGVRDEVLIEGKERYRETSTAGVYVSERDASIAAPSAPPPRRDGEVSRTWVEIGIRGGWLIAYEAERPVFVTLISPGRGGPPVRGIDPLKTASTPTGTYQVDGKFLSATMVSSTNSDIVHTQVQYVQNFHGPHALHGAYWHDSWGKPMSGGCVNLSPKDSKWLFEWTEPRLPPGWHGMRSLKDFGPPTIVVVHP